MPTAAAAALGRCIVTPTPWPVSLPAATDSAAVPLLLRLFLQADVAAVAAAVAEAL